jgi:hypothetical protein
MGWGAIVAMALVLALAGPAGASSIAQLDGAAGCVVEGGAPGCTAAAGLGDPSNLAIAPDGRSAYVAGDGVDPTAVGGRPGGGGVAAFSRDPASGALTPLPGPAGCLSDGGTDGLSPQPCTPIAGLQAAYALTLSPDGANVYVLGSTRVGVGAEMGIGLRNGPPVLWVFARDPGTSALTLLQGSAACLGKVASCARYAYVGEPVLSPDGRFVYTGAHSPGRPGAATGAIGILARGPDGALTPAGCLRRTAGHGCGKARGMADLQGLVLSPDGRTLWASVYADRPDGQFGGFGLLTFRRNSSTGKLRQLAGKRGCTLARAMPRRLAAGCARVRSSKVMGLPLLARDGTGYAAFGAFNGTLTPVRLTGSTILPAGAPIPALYGQLALSPDGAAAYRTHGTDYGAFGFGSLTAYARDASTGALSSAPGPTTCAAEAVGDLSHAGEYQAAPKSPPCAPARALAGSSSSTVSPDRRFVYVVSGLQAAPQGAVAVFSVGA